MTTEIGILNRSAIALAADSAVTVRNAMNSSKVYNTANKLFALSKYAPVGIMVYGDATVMGIPWETIIKRYRHLLGKKKFEKLNDYYNDFTNYLDKFDFPADSEQTHIEQVSYGIAVTLENQLKAHFDNSSEEVTPESVAAQLKEEFSKLAKFIETTLLPLQKNKWDFDKLKTIHGKTIRNIFPEIRQTIPLLENDEESFINLLLIASTTCMPNGASGIVIAGFGESEMFPSLINFDMCAVLQGKCVTTTEKNHIGSDPAIIPFAQRDDISSFIEGIAPNLKYLIEDSLSGMVESLKIAVRDEIIGKMDHLDDVTKKNIEDNIGQICNGAKDTMVDNFHKYQREQYISPIINTTGVLNKEELSNMAETLVSLVSFRKQVTSDDETVGGPIDVAVITKGDGLIWIKRKHYFDPKLNQHYFANYYE